MCRPWCHDFKISQSTDMFLLFCLFLMKIFPWGSVSLVFPHIEQHQLQTFFHYFIFKGVFKDQHTVCRHRYWEKAPVGSPCVCILSVTVSNILCPKARWLGGRCEPPGTVAACRCLHCSTIRGITQPTSHQPLDKTTGNEDSSKDKKTKTNNPKETALHHVLLATVKTSLRGINSKQNSTF